jgi:hypothetical protein
MAPSRPKTDWASVQKHIEQFPHCDPLILHKPGICGACDGHADWQALRIAWEINFTGEEDPQKAPCPSAKYRPAYQAHRWHGNHPDVPVPLQAPTAWEHLNNDDDDDGRGVD